MNLSDPEVAISRQQATKALRAGEKALNELIEASREIGLKIEVTSDDGRLALHITDGSRPNLRIVPGEKESA